MYTNLQDTLPAPRLPDSLPSPVPQRETTTSTLYPQLDDDSMAGNQLPNSEQSTSTQQQQWQQHTHPELRSSQFAQPALPPQAPPHHTLPYPPYPPNPYPQEPAMGIPHGNESWRGTHGPTNPAAPVYPYHQGNGQGYNYAPYQPLPHQEGGRQGKNQKAVSELRTKYDLLDGLFSKNKSVCTIETSLTMSRAKAMIEEINKGEVPSREKVKELVGKVEEAMHQMKQRGKFADSLESQGVVYIGRSGSSKLEKVLQSNPHAEIYIFHFKFSSMDEQSKNWRTFQHLIDYSNNVEHCLCIAVSINIR